MSINKIQITNLLRLGHVTNQIRAGLEDFFSRVSFINVAYAQKRGENMHTAHPTQKNRMIYKN